jgi:hypothetical protein
MLVIGSSLIVLTVVFVVFYNMFFQNVNVDFTEKITFKYEYLDKKINVQITDKNDMNTLISMCKGIAIMDSPSCGFGVAELIFEGEQKKISIYPACDGCDLMEVNDTDKYFDIGAENRKKLVELLKKYGAIFPCI